MGPWSSDSTEHNTLHTQALKRPAARVPNGEAEEPSIPSDHAEDYIGKPQPTSLKRSYGRGVYCSAHGFVTGRKSVFACVVQDAVLPAARCQDCRFIEGYRRRKELEVEEVFVLLSILLAHVIVVDIKLLTPHRCRIARRHP